MAAPFFKVASFGSLVFIFLLFFCLFAIYSFIIFLLIWYWLDYRLNISLWNFKVTRAFESFFSVDSFFWRSFCWAILLTRRKNDDDELGPLSDILTIVILWHSAGRVSYSLVEWSWEVVIITTVRCQRMGSLLSFSNILKYYD